MPPHSTDTPHLKDVQGAPVMMIDGRYFLFGIFYIFKLPRTMVVLLCCKNENVREVLLEVE